MKESLISIIQERVLGASFIRRLQQRLSTASSNKALENKESAVTAAQQNIPENSMTQSRAGSGDINNNRT